MIHPSSGKAIPLSTNAPTSRLCTVFLFSGGQKKTFIQVKKKFVYWWAYQYAHQQALHSVFVLCTTTRQKSRSRTDSDARARAHTHTHTHKQTHWRTHIDDTHKTRREKQGDVEERDVHARSYIYIMCVCVYVTHAHTYTCVCIHTTHTHTQ